VASALEESGTASEWIDVKEFMHTDANFGKARPVVDITTERIQRLIRPLVASGRVPVTQGFIGVTALGEYTTMGRESSDYSATVIGALLPASKVQIWTDVDGILTADPRIIGQVRKVRKMSFEEAFQLSIAGAKVLHPTTMVPVMEKEIPVQILNSKKEGSGTTIEIESLEARGVVKSIAHKRGMAVLAFSPIGPGASGAFHGKVMPLLSARGVTPQLVTIAGENAVMLIDRQAIDEDLVSDLKVHGTVTVHTEKSSITLVGKGIGGRSDIIGKAAAIASMGNLTMISGPTSEISLTLVVDTEHLSTVLANLHKALIEEIDDAEIFDVVSRRPSRQLQPG
jgi:aspartate kinase